jgi:hypothetical protein
MPMTEITLPQAHPKVMWTALPDGAVLYETDSEQYFGVNSVGALVWELLPPVTSSFEALCRAVHARYSDVDFDQICQDVSELLDDLKTLGLVQHVEAS